MFDKISQAVLILTFLIKAFVTLIESPGNGPAKEVEVILRLKEALKLLDSVIDLPDGLKSFLTNDTFLAILVKITVFGFNLAGIFPKETPAK